MIIDKITKNGKNIVLEQIENGCMICLSHCRDKDGYVRIQYEGKQDRLHRVIYEIKYGKIPNGLVIRHKCDNPYCCNIEHLEIGTRQDNVNDMIERGRDSYHKPALTSRGTLSKFNKLSEKDVIDIYNSPLGYKKLGKLYGVSANNIRLIKKQLSWKWLTDSIKSN